MEKGAMTENKKEIGDIEDLAGVIIERTADLSRTAANTRGIIQMGPKKMRSLPNI